MGLFAELIKKYDYDHSFIDVLINMHSNIETTYIALQMLRNININLKIFLYVSDQSLKSHPYINLFKEFNCIVAVAGHSMAAPKPSSGTPVDTREWSREDCHYTIAESINWYLNHPAGFNAEYVLFTFGDHWVLEPEKLTPFLETIINKSYDYDGFTFLTNEASTVYSTSFFVLKRKFLYDLITHREEMFPHNCGWESKFYNIYKELNWYIPFPNKSWHQYNYKPWLGVGHFHTFEQKKHYLNLWKEKYKIEILYDEDALCNENSPWNHGHVIGDTLEADMSIQ